MSTQTAENTKVTTGKVRLSYANIWEARAMDDEDSDKSVKKFSTAILIAKDDKVTINKIKKAIEAAKAQGKAAKWGGKIPANLKIPLRDGDAEKPDDENYAGHYFLNASSTQRPQIFDKDLNEILDKEEVYSGVYARVSLNFFPYNKKSNGIAAGLNGIQKIKDGEPLSGRGNVAEDFSEPYDDEDPENEIDTSFLG